jgi:hypothetical protein
MSVAPMRHAWNVPDDRSPWADPESAHVFLPPPATAVPSRAHQPIETRELVGAAHGVRAAGSPFGAGNVSGTPIEVPKVEEPPPWKQDVDTRKRTMLMFGGGALAVIAAGVAVIVMLALTGNNPLASTTAGPPDTRSALAKACPPPSGAAAPLGAIPAVPAGDRTVDQESGISYKAYGAPWTRWRDVWDKAGELKISYKVGQYFITERYSSFGVENDYLASILSAKVPAATNDALTLDLKCTGKQVAADVRSEYYPQPNTMDMLRDEATTLGGRPAWITEFRLHFHEEGLKATDELAAVAVIDVGRPDAAILYISIPGTHRQYDYVIDEVLDSVRPTG